MSQHQKDWRRIAVLSLGMVAVLVVGFIAAAVFLANNNTEQKPLVAVDYPISTTPFISQTTSASNTTPPDSTPAAPSTTAPATANATMDNTSSPGTIVNNGGANTMEDNITNPATGAGTEAATSKTEEATAPVLATTAAHTTPVTTRLTLAPPNPTTSPAPTPTHQTPANTTTPPGKSGPPGIVQIEPISPAPMTTPSNNQSLTVTGRVMSYNKPAALLSLAQSGGPLLPIKISAGTLITMNGATVKATDIQISDVLTVTGTVNSQGQLETSAITIAPRSVKKPY